MTVPLQCVIAPLAGALVNKFGYRPVSVFGAVWSAFGFAVSTMSPNIDVMMLTYGIIGGTRGISDACVSLLLSRVSYVRALIAST